MIFQRQLSHTIDWSDALITLASQLARAVYDSWFSVDCSQRIDTGD
jgi:hypothetical protein